MIKIFESSGSWFWNVLAGTNHMERFDILVTTIHGTHCFENILQVIHWISFDPALYLNGIK